MKGDQIFIDGKLYKFDYGGSGPPWPFLVWNEDVQDWQAIANDLSRHSAASLLVLVPSPYNFVDSSTSDNGQPVDFVTTALGDVIGVEGL